jgi:deoxyribonuclease-4
MTVLAFRGDQGISEAGGGVGGMLLPRVGAHVSVAGGLDKAPARAVRQGCETFQVFLGNPRGWAEPPADPTAEARFREEVAALRLGPVFVHAAYLINLASTSELSWERSRALLAATLERAASSGVAGVVVHAGSHMGAGRAWGLARVREALLPLLEKAGDSGPDLLLELTAGTRGALAARFEEMAELLAACDHHPRLKVCMDTAHAHAAGYDLSQAAGAAAALDELSAAIGDRLALVHANDSAVPLGACRDHHANVGAGTIGADGFAAMLAHPTLAGLPVLVETPGSDDDRAADVALLKSLRPPDQAR